MAVIGPYIRGHLCLREIICNLTINTKAVEKLLQKLTINKVSEPDDLPAYILRDTVTELAPDRSVIVRTSQ